jgi:hypothetical protein
MVAAETRDALLHEHQTDEAARLAGKTELGRLTSRLACPLSRKEQTSNFAPSSAYNPDRTAGGITADPSGHSNRSNGYPQRMV